MYKFVIDSDALIKLTKTGLLEQVCRHYNCAITSEVKEESVDEGKKRFYKDALKIEELIGKKLLKVIELKKVKSTASAVRQKKYLDQFTAQVNDDLNTPQALATMWDMLKDGVLSAKDKLGLLLKFDAIFGLDLKTAEEEKIPPQVLRLALERLQARQKKDWKKSDELRGKINQLGYTIGDTKDGFELKKE